LRGRGGVYVCRWVGYDVHDDDDNSCLCLLQWRRW
jgi:hypothetical protein